MENYKPPKFLSFPSSLKGIRINNGKEEIKVLCSDNKCHWIDYARYKNNMKVGFQNRRKNYGKKD